MRWLVLLLTLAPVAALAQVRNAPPSPNPAAANPAAGNPASANAPSNSPNELGSGPVTVEADRGIEWRRDENVYVATGNAKAVRGNITVTADQLVAHYRETSGGSTDIYRLDAVGNVTIATPNERATGEQGVYDVDKQVMVMTGRNLKFTTPQQVVTARDSLEYWQGRRIAVARGGAQAVAGDRKVNADILQAHVSDDARTKQSRISKVDGFGNVNVSTPTEAASGAKGVYNMDTSIATLVGDVKVSQGRNQLNGEYAEVNLNTGISRILSGPAAGKEGRMVRALLVPEQGRAPTGGAAGTPAPSPAPAPAPQAKRK